MSSCKLRCFRQLRSNHNILIKLKYIVPYNLQFNTCNRSFLEINPELSKTYYIFFNLVVILIIIVSSHYNISALKICLSKVYVSYVNYRGNWSFPNNLSYCGIQLFNISTNIKLIVLNFRNMDYDEEEKYSYKTPKMNKYYWLSA